MSEVATRVREIIAEQLMVDVEEVVDEANLVDDLGADSLDAVELVMALEQELEIEISDEEAETIKTVGQAIALVEKKLEGAPQEAG